MQGIEVESELMFRLTRELEAARAIVIIVNDGQLAIREDEKTPVGHSKIFVEEILEVSARASFGPRQLSAPSKRTTHCTPGVSSQTPHVASRISTKLQEVNSSQ
jgi:hypothetical protein